MDHFLGHKRKWHDSRWETLGIKFAGQGKIDDDWFMEEIRKSNVKGRCTEPLAQACLYIMIGVFHLLSSKTTCSRHGARAPKGAEMEAVWDYCIGRIVNVHKWGGGWSQGQTNPVRVVFVTIQRHVRSALWTIWYDKDMRAERKLGMYLSTHVLERLDNASRTYEELTKHAN